MRVTGQIVEKFNNNIDESLFQFADFDEKEAEKAGRSNYSYWKSTWNSFLNHKVAVLLLILVIGLLLFTVIQPILPYQKSPITIYINPETKLQNKNVAPCAEFWFGTNSIGQDLWARIWSGTRTSLLIGIAVGAVEALVGIIVGALWGYVKSLEKIITEIYNVMDNIPTTIVLILMTYIFKPSIKTMIFALCLTGWLEMARFVRNQIIIIRDREYNLASRCLGTPTIRIIFKNLLPYLVSVIMLRMALAIPSAIGSEVFLTYIGLGLPISIPSLGNLVNEGRILMMTPSLRYQLIFPSVMISIITVAFYVIGNTFADAADPKNHI